MAGIVKNLLNVSIIALTLPTMALGVQKENPRSSVASRDNVTDNSASSIIARSVTANNRQNRSVVNTRSAVQNARSTNSVVTANSSARAATRGTVARSGAVSDVQSGKNTSRANVARATAVFNDVTKIGGGFASCRDAYATCMDQICANANDTYRRCYCSDRFTGFRETSEKLDNALSLLAQFQDNNLEVVDKSAAEVNAMYSASEGEKKIKKDTSASQKLLNSISSILADRSTTKKSTNLNSLGVLDLSGFSLDDDDIWGGTSSIFGGSSYEDLSALEGKELYNKAHKQCEEIIRESCSGEAIFNLARSSYSIMINQDCNLYEKSINAKRASVEETVRTAEKYLREARLEEYRAHNSADVVECLTKVEEAARNDVVCGANYEKCMDYTGRYIDVDTGKPIYGPKLFGLNSLIVLNGSADVLKANANYDKWFDGTIKKLVSAPLDSCRDISETVWREFKRSALIKIAQAQDDAIQNIKDSCVETIKNCYDDKSETLNDIDTTESQYAGARSAIATRGLCYENVLACAALYGDQDGCKYDDKTKKITNTGGKKCGLQSLLAYVDTVDSLKVAEGCETSLRKYAHTLCDPKVADGSVYPMGCLEEIGEGTLRAKMDTHRENFCPKDAIENDTANVLSGGDVNAFNINIMNQVIRDIYDELKLALVKGCEEDSNGEWQSLPVPSADELSPEFYKKYFGVTSIASYNTSDQIQKLNEMSNNAGWCVMSAERRQCYVLSEQQYATWNTTTGECELTNAWYKNRCLNFLGGTSWTGSYCIVDGVQVVVDDEIY